MTLPASGAISVSAIQSELAITVGGQNSLNDASFRNLSGVASGAVSMSNFYGKSNSVTLTINLSSNTQNYVLNTAKVPGYVAGHTTVTLVINSGIVLGSASTGSAALSVDTSWNASDIVNVINNGYIVGAGGNGGNGGTTNNQNGTVGSAAGLAISILRATTITNNGTIGGGGGGGAGGKKTLLSGCSIYTSGGGGGGAGYNAGAGGSASGGTTGSAGNTTSGGAAGSGCGSGSSGGAGGALGSAGSSAPVSGTAGGAAGACTAGNSNITWSTTGTRYGALN